MDRAPQHERPTRGRFQLEARQRRQVHLPPRHDHRPNGYLILALNPDTFKQHYRVETPVLGPLKKNLQRNGERLELYSANNEVIDAARYDDRAPYPITPDGYASSLERIAPTAPADSFENWAASPFPPLPAPSGTPGKQNAAFSATLPPVISALSITPQDPKPEQDLRVVAQVKSPQNLKDVTLLFRVVRSGDETPDAALPMTREGDGNTWTATIPAQAHNTIVRVRIKATDESDVSRLHPADHDLRPAISLLVHDKWDLASLPAANILTIRSSDPAQRTPRRGSFLRLFGGGGPEQANPNAPRPTRGSHAFVFSDLRTGKTTLFDYVHAHPRGRGNGFTVHLHKDRMLDNMTALTMLHEGSDRHLLAESLAYDLYRRAGNIAPHSRFVRFAMDNRVVGHHLMIERPNKGFLRRNKIDDSGNLYKLLWYGRGIVGQHEKRTNPQSGHADLLALVEKLNRTAQDPDAQWKVIQENFDVENAATFFAINQVLSDWDGFFNNYYTYHDPKTNKWLMIPWDRDKTWGFHDGIAHDHVFTTLPLANGMEGDNPGARHNQQFDRNNAGGGNPFGHGTPWWRPGGHFSRPLLANPHFRKLYLQKIRTILDKHYTKDVYFPLIDAVTKDLKSDLTHRAQSTNSDATWLTQNIDHAAELLKTHLTKRREYLLAQDELQALAGPAK